MEKLELKHLGAYLPYKLKGWGNRHKHILVAVSIERMDGFWDRLDGIDMFGVYGQGLIKPMLRPLSTIIEDDQIISLIFDLGGKMSDAIHDWIKYAESDAANIDNAILCAPFPVIEWALEKHIDIFSLIQKGLAVPLT